MAANSRPSVERAGDREKSLEAALLQIERQFGKGSVMRLGEETRAPVEVIPTGSIALDVAHDRALAELPLDLEQRGLQGFLPVARPLDARPAVCCHGDSLPGKGPAGTSRTAQVV